MLRCVRWSYAKDDIIIRQGDDIDSFYFCVNGFSKLAIEDDTKENSYKDRTPYDVLSNCVEAPHECMPLDDEDIPEEEDDSGHSNVKTTHCLEQWNGQK